MPRSPDLPCARCGELMWRSRTSLEPGKATCRECRKALRPAPKASAPAPARVPRYCAICGEALNPRKHHTELTCSRECGVELRRRRGSLPAQARGPRAYYSRVYIRPCRGCGDLFVGRSPNAVLCSDQCRYQRDKPNLLAGAHTRRARMAEVRSEPISIQALAERDGWVCGLCHQAVRPSQQPYDPLGPSIDHIRPIHPDDGGPRGEHTWANVQLAHLWCNWSKGNRTDHQSSVDDRIDDRISSTR